MARSRLPWCCQRQPRVRHARLGAVLDRIERGDVDLHQPMPTGDQQPRAGREILESGADRNDEVGLGNRRVGGAGAGNADAAEIVRVIVWQRALARLRFGKGQPCSRRSEERTSELQSLMRISYAVFCLKKKTDDE